MKAIARGLSPSRKEWQSNDWLALPQKLLIDKKQISCRKRKLPSQTNSCFRWFGSYNMRKISQINSQFPFVFLWSPEPLKVQGFGTFWKTKSNWDKINTERRKCSPLIFATAAIFPSYFHGGIKARESNVKMEKKTRRVPCSGAPRVVQIHNSLHSSPRRSR